MDRPAVELFLFSASSLEDVDGGNLLSRALVFLVPMVPGKFDLRISFSPLRASSRSSVVFRRANESCLSLTRVFSCLKKKERHPHSSSLPIIFDFMHA